MNSKIVIGLLVLLAGVGVGWYFLGGYKPQEAPAPKEVTTQESVPASPSGASMEKDQTAAKTVVNFTADGFSPKEVTVKKGTTVTFVNTSSASMWVASAVHPTHQELPGFDQLKSVGSGGSYEYTFVKAGSWKYHNHVAPANTGTVIVTE